jgi:hypothetical protein
MADRIERSTVPKTVQSSVVETARLAVTETLPFSMSSGHENQMNAEDVVRFEQSRKDEGPCG